MPGYFRRASSISFGLMSSPVQIASMLAQQAAEHAGAAAQVGHPCAGGKLAQPDDRLDQAGAAFRFEHVIGVGRRVAVEKRDFLALVLLVALRTGRIWHLDGFWLHLGGRSIILAGANTDLSGGQSRVGIIFNSG